jgi:hypothetical protein
MAGFLLAVAALASAPPAMAVEPTGAALTLSPDAPARLVLAYWPSGGWQVRQSGRQVELVLPGAGLDISTGAVALPAGDGAIATLATGIDEGATYLRIGLGCDCTLAVRGDGERLLIDVVGAGRAAGPSYRDAGPAPRLAPLPPARYAGAAVAAGVTDDQRVEETRSRLLEELRSAAEAGLVTLRPNADGALAEAGEHPPAPDRGPEPEPVEPSGETLADASGPAADDVHPGASVARATASEAPVLAGTPAPDQPAGPHPLSGTVPQIEPEIERDTQVVSDPPDRPLDLVAAAPAPACFGNEAFRLTDPLPVDALTAEFARLRRALIGEFDRVDTPFALSLARLYLAHGLGVEALGVLAEFAPDAPETGLLAALAWLAEGRPLPAPNILSVSGCTGQHALWQALDAALAGRPAEALEREAAAAGALEQTARGLRGRIAVRLGLAATAEHDWIAAHRLNAMAKRAIAGDDRDGREMRLLLEAKLSLGRGDMTTALARLKTLRGARSPAGAEALLMLAGLATDPANGAGVRPDRLRLDLGVLALVHRDTPLGGRAFLGEAELTGHLFGRDAAFELLAYGYSARMIGEPVYRDALGAVGASQRSGRDDTPLALVYEADPERFAQTLADPGFRLALARSYIGLGAPVLAEAVLRPGDLQDEIVLEDLARIYLEIGEAEAAARFARKLPEGPARAAIDAGVALARGDAVAALAALNAAGATAPQRARTAWAAGDWSASARALVEEIAVRRSGEEPETGDKASPAALAARLALAARRAGRAAVPPEAVYLATAESGLAAGLQAMFVSPADDLADPSPTAVGAYLEGVSAEARLFEELLEDG